MEKLRKIGALIALCLGCAGVQGQSLQVRELNDGRSSRQLHIGEWTPAVIPGTIYQDLLREGRIEGSSSRGNECSLLGIDRRDPECRALFDAPESVDRDRMELCSDKPDTYAADCLSGKCVPESANIFRRYRIDGTRTSRPADNKLRDAFSSPVRGGHERLMACGIVLEANDHQSVLGSLWPVKTAPFGPNDRASGFIQSELFFISIGYRE